MGEFVFGDLFLDHLPLEQGVAVEFPDGFDMVEHMLADHFLLFGIIVASGLLDGGRQGDAIFEALPDHGMPPETEVVLAHPIDGGVGARVNDDIALAVFFNPGVGFGFPIGKSHMREQAEGSQEQGACNEGETPGQSWQLEVGVSRRITVGSRRCKPR